MEAADLDFITDASLAPITLGAAAYVYFTARRSAASQLLALFLVITAIRTFASVRFLIRDDPALAGAIVETETTFNLFSWNAFAAFLWFYPSRLRARSLHGALFLGVWAVLAATTLGRLVRGANDDVDAFVEVARGGVLHIMLLLGCVSAFVRIPASDATERRIASILLPALILSPFTSNGSYAMGVLLRAPAEGFGAFALPPDTLGLAVHFVWIGLTWGLALWLALRWRSFMAVGILAFGLVIGATAIIAPQALGLFTVAFLLRSIVPVHVGQRFGAFGMQAPGGAASYVLPAIMFSLLFLIGNAVVISIAPDSAFTAPLGVFLGLTIGVIAAAMTYPRRSWDLATSTREPVDDGLLLGRYRRLRRLGAGAQGVTELCHDERLHRDVVVKTVPVTSGEALREARALARVHHPNVVTVFDAEEGAGQVHIVMEHVPGGSLRGLLAREKRLPPAEAARLVAGVLAGVEACHTKGILHRDIKPENVLLGPDGVAKLADFGLARDRGANATLVGSIGTLAYLAPEQLRGEPADARSDVYAVGVILAEALSGRAPLAPGTDDFEARERGRRGVLVALPAEAGALAEVVARATAADPALRYPSAAAMRTALTAASRVQDEEREAA